MVMIPEEKAVEKDPDGYIVKHEGPNRAQRRATARTDRSEKVRGRDLAIGRKQNHLSGAQMIYNFKAMRRAMSNIRMKRKEVSDD